MVDGPTTGVKRQQISFKRATLTPIKLKIPRSVGTASLKPMLEKQDLEGLWQKTAWAKKIAQRAARKETDDFGRFKIMLARKKKSSIVGKAFKKQRKAQ